MKTPYNIPPSIYNAFNICKRQAWLMHRQLNADQQNTFLELGKLIDETSYTREKKKIYLADISAQIDMVTRKNGEIFIAEIKKSSKRIDNAIIQLKYYLYLLQKKSFKMKGLLTIPKEKKNIEVELNEGDIQFIENNLAEIEKVINRESPPDIAGKNVCSKCAHNEFCRA